MRHRKNITIVDIWSFGVIFMNTGSDQNGLVLVRTQQMPVDQKHSFILCVLNQFADFRPIRTEVIVIIIKSVEMNSVSERPLRGLVADLSCHLPLWGLSGWSAYGIWKFGFHNTHAWNRHLKGQNIAFNFTGFEIYRNWFTRMRDAMLHDYWTCTLIQVGLRVRTLTYIKFEMIHVITFLDKKLLRNST